MFQSDMVVSNTYFYRMPKLSQLTLVAGTIGTDYVIYILDCHCQMKVDMTPKYIRLVAKHVRYYSPILTTALSRVYFSETPKIYILSQLYPVSPI